MTFGVQTFTIRKEQKKDIKDTIKFLEDILAKID